MTEKEKIWWFGYLCGAGIMALVFILIWTRTPPEASQSGRGGSAYVGGCGVAIGGASGDGKPGSVVIRKCPQ